MNSANAIQAVEKEPNKFSTQSRTKVTIACNACRKRRAKCTGIWPCWYCVQSQEQCIFDTKNRARRGPRPQDQSAHRRNGMRDAQLSAGACSSATCLLNECTTNDGSIQSLVPIQEPTPPILELQCSTVAQYDEDQQQDEPPDLSTWRAGLERILFNGRYAITYSQRTNLDIACHFSEIFWQHPHSRLSLVLSRETYFERLQNGNMLRSLVHAICANSIAYSTHAQTTRTKSANLGYDLVRQARVDLQNLSLTDRFLEQLQSYCFLVEYSLREGDGSQAWVDIGFARSFLELGRTADTPNNCILDAIDEYLAMSAAIMSIGNPALRLPLWSLEGTSDVTSVEGNDMMHIIHSLIRIEQLCQEPLSEQEPLPWQAGSAFRKIQDLLDGQLVQCRYVLTPGKRSPQSLGDYSLESSIYYLTAHCGRITLSRGFLPIPLENIVHFPNAPHLFLEEQIMRCESSATTICRICKAMVANGQFLEQPYWVGLSCMLSALVLMNQLHRRLDDHDREIVNNLDFTLYALKLLRRFFGPARQWHDLLLRMHNTDSRIVPTLYSSESNFSNFYSRFPYLKDPGFIPLKFSSIQSATSPVALSPKPGDGHGHEQGSYRNHTTDRDNDWIAVYTSALQDNQQCPKLSGMGICPDREDSTSIAKDVAPSRTDFQGQITASCDDMTHCVLDVGLLDATGCVSTSMNNNLTVPNHETRHDAIVSEKGPDINDVASRTQVPVSATADKPSQSATESADFWSTMMLMTMPDN